MSGPLSDIKVLEFAGIGPGPFCGMLLADMGAEVLRVDRSPKGGSKHIIEGRGKKSVVLNLKDPNHLEICLDLVSQADILQEGMRPGKMEDLGLGPDECFKVNKRIVYGRMTGWGQYGSLSQAAGHDINYISLTGALDSIGRKGDKPVPPLNLVGDFGGGALYLAMGMLAALHEAKISGKGQVVDCAMTDGSASLMSMFYGFSSSGIWNESRGSNLLDTGAHFYDVYETKDKKFISIGSIEPQFYALLLEKAEIQDPDFDDQMERDIWPTLKSKIEEIFKMKNRDEWCEIMEGTDVCFSPVLSISEAPHHQHNIDRKTFVEFDGVMQPNAAPRFSRTESKINGPSALNGQHNETALLEWGISKDRIKDLF
ncbi:MAG: carnitine dehydratase [Rhodobiaceae bacterium]|nr:carnitine dehydratase [Rhodobiaceae bacterium]|tara:strand:- start:15023 stop:16132 length:1110 start_codon:yes stop_codon:yes gene_type:complete